jgi:prepilin-type N-terminal cleavage/methylation domain-containing protein
MRGYTLVELLAAVAVMLTVLAVSVPLLERGRQEGRVRGAAFHLSSRCAWLRMSAVQRNANAAFHFVETAGVHTMQPFLDGDWDGVRSADIAAGRDPSIGPVLAVDALFPGARFGFVPGCPLVDGSAVPAEANPIRIGSAKMLVFTPDGASSGGTLYLRGTATHTSAYAVVLLAATGRTRVLRCTATSGTWHVAGR